MGSDTSKLQRSPGSSRTTASMQRRLSATGGGRSALPPAIRIGTSASYNEGFGQKGSPRKSDSKTPEEGEFRSRSGSANSERNGSKQKHILSMRNRQLIQSCFNNPHEILGKKILKRASEKRHDFGKFMLSLNTDQKEELEESLKILLKKAVANIEFMEEVQRLANEFGERYVQYRLSGFKADFFSAIADSTITELTFLDNAVHPAHQTLNAFSHFVTLVFSAVRDGFYGEMRRQRRTSNSFSTGSNGSARRKKTSVDSNEAMSPRSTSPGGESRLSDECFLSSGKESVCEPPHASNGFLRPPSGSMLTARTC